MGMIGTLTDREYQKFKEAVDGSPATQIYSINQLVPEEYDSITLVYTGNNVTTITFKVGGTGGTAVATLTLGYTGNNVTSVAKT